MSSLWINGQTFYFRLNYRYKIQQKPEQTLIIFENKKRTPSGKKYALVEKKSRMTFTYIHIYDMYTQEQRTWFSRKAFYQLEKG